MTIDQCKARILAVLSQELNHATYENLKIEVGAFTYAPIFAVALKELILDGEVVRIPHIKVDENSYAMVLYRGNN